MPLQSRMDINRNMLTLRSARLNNDTSIFNDLSREVCEEYFRPYLVQAAASPNLVFYDRYLDRVVDYPYPMSNGELILPDGIQAYNDRRRQGFECLCASLYKDVYVFIRILKIGKESWGVCDDCGLQVCFNDKFQTCYLVNDYTGYKKIAETQPARSAPDVNRARYRALARAEMRQAQRFIPQGLAAAARTRRTRSSIGYEAINTNPLFAPGRGTRSGTPSSSRSFSPTRIRSSGIRHTTCPATLTSHYESASTALGHGSSNNSFTIGSSSNVSSPELVYELCECCGQCFVEDEFPAHGCFISD
ncbi:hypothetical protein M422DRAFT_242164 [Sphaerobolus stellatus SS14]|nr:hypothetical protein M422DRAFT_242164 [Sphaerobolus stellatus SS14]